jgi:uncharacterized membrane protein
MTKFSEAMIPFIFLFILVLITTREVLLNLGRRRNEWCKQDAIKRLRRIHHARIRVGVFPGLSSSPITKMLMELADMTDFMRKD